MDRGIYSSSSGGLISSRRLEVVSNNLANVNTVGFKAERIASRQQEFADTLASALPDPTGRASADFDRSPGVVDVGTVTDFSPGPIQSTGIPLHVALTKKNQFFVVQTPAGEAYTRAGNFTMTSEGNLVTQDGLPVQGDGGTITLPPGPARISNDGSVLAGKELIGKVRVVEIDDTSKLKRTEGVRFTLEQGAQARPLDTADVVTESVEMPNVSVVDAMVDMIVAQKGFEAYTKTVRTLDELNDRAIRGMRNG